MTKDETLAQPEQEPVYWQWRRKDEDWQVRMIFSHEVHATTEDSEVRTLHTTPPQRKPLTDEQIDEIYYKSELEIERQYNQLYAFARDIEAAHGIKE